MTLIQYIVLSERLAQDWGVGPTIAQACHASGACLAKYWEDPLVKEYTSNLDTMHKVVLKVDLQTDLENLSIFLKEQSIDHYLWREHPENIISAIAIKPYHREFVKPQIQNLKLFPKLLNK